MNAELPEHFWLASKVIFSQFLKYIFLLYQHWIGAEGTCISKLTLGNISSASAASAASALHQQHQHCISSADEAVGQGYKRRTCDCKNLVIFYTSSSCFVCPPTSLLHLWLDRFKGVSELSQQPRPLSHPPTHLLTFSSEIWNECL